MITVNGDSKDLLFQIIRNYILNAKQINMVTDYNGRYKYTTGKLEIIDNRIGIPNITFCGIDIVLDETLNKTLLSLIIIEKDKNRKYNNQHTR